MQRPMTSSNRPTTSKGRPKTAGLNNIRPSSRRNWRNNNESNNTNDRPNTTMRTSLSRAQRTESRNGVILQKNEPTSGGIRPITGRRLETSSIQNRPMTKQGLSANIPPSRLGTVMKSRLVYDKSYYKGILNNKINTIVSELDNLKNELEQGEIDRQQVLFYEQKAEDQASEIRELQAQLHEFNIIIDKINTNSDLEEILIDYNEVQEANEKLAEELDKVYKDHREKEAEIKSLEDKLNVLKHQYNQQLAALDPSLKDRHENLIKEVEIKKNSIKEASALVNSLDKKREEIDNAIGSAPLKQQALVLNERILELKSKKKKIEEEISTNETPEDLRDRLLEQVKKNNEEIEIMENQIDDIMQNIENIKEEINEFDNNFETLVGDKSEKYREMMIMEKQIDEFFNNFITELSTTARILQEKEREIVGLLLKISINMEKDNEYENMEIQNKESNDPEVLAEVHLDLQEKLLQIADKVWEVEQQIEDGKKEYQKIQNKLGIDNENLNGENINNKRKKLETIKNTLQIKENELNQLKNKNKELMIKLKENENYDKIIKLEEANINKQKEIDILKEKVEKLRMTKDFETIKNNCLEKYKKLNLHLIELNK
ncbi:Intraflagellar transport protein 74 homolog [Strongyloides ratti]|uniref:Intraflagellar transport protein 74 homolog n=1 Tax=Strongyloides ratti TaxID=34506 RepID=A0A090LL11_STRRB|nr:Intraflagellar transport protein 74 homolog [Strongyloides ratti]CEF68205.1 Intraflagellar transport protein 74 homolog [Strongyloides ratti]